MSYRDDLQATRDRAEGIAGQLREVRRRMNEVIALGERAGQLETELSQASKAAGRARARTALPLLSNLRVASPCHERWEDMTGDARARHCGMCDKDVFDLSAMTAENAEKMLAEHKLNLCVRFYRRPDGTVMTTDCVPGARRKRRRNIAFGIGAAALTLVGGAGAIGAAATCTMGEPDQVVMGAAPTVDPEEFTVGEVVDEQVGDSVTAPISVDADEWKADTPRTPDDGPEGPQPVVP